MYFSLNLGLLHDDLLKLAIMLNAVTMTFELQLNWNKPIWKVFFNSTKKLKPESERYSWILGLFYVLWPRREAITWHEV